MIQCQCDAHCVMQVTWQSGSMGAARIRRGVSGLPLYLAIQSIGVDRAGQLLFNLDISRAGASGDAGHDSA